MPQRFTNTKSVNLLSVKPVCFHFQPPYHLKKKKKKSSTPVLFERTTLGTLSSCGSQLCPNILKAIHTGSTPFRHLGSSFRDINTRGNETQSNGLRDGELRRSTEMPLHLTYKVFLLNGVVHWENSPSLLLKHHDGGCRARRQRRGVSGTAQPNSPKWHERSLKLQRCNPLSCILAGKSDLVFCFVFKPRIILEFTVRWANYV